MLEEPLGGGGVFLHVSHEYLGPVARLEPEAVLGVGDKGTQPIDLHAGAFGQTLPDQTGQVRTRLPIIFGHDQSASPITGAGRISAASSTAIPGNSARFNITTS